MTSVSRNPKTSGYKSKRCPVCGKVPRDRDTEAAEVLAPIMSPGGFA